MDSLTSISTFTSTCTPQLSALEAAVGNTPLLPLRRLTAGLNPAVQVFAKAEWFNPGGSVKDRPALNILITALCDGSLGIDMVPFPGKRLLDSTSGNMGIAYATFAAALGIPVTLVLPENASAERIAILRALGAELIFTDPAEGSDGAIRAVRELAANSGDRYWYANQYDNPANWQAHYLTTGPEIVQQTNSQVTHFIAGLGTSGTLIGVGRYLKAFDPSIQVIAGQPARSFHGLEGLKHMPSALRPGIYDPAFPDRIISIETEDAYEMVRRLAREEGLFVGISSGAAAWAAIQLARELDRGMIVTVFPDAGYKYLSDHEIWGTKQP
jgi:S-sulfo-L-cysteine synthase (O-acetyl-L-serine-dependent)